MLKQILSATLLLGLTTTAIGQTAPIARQPIERGGITTVTYTFYGYCDGIQLTQNTQTKQAVGYHLETNCSSSAFDPNAGGFESKVGPISRDKLWIASTSDYAATSNIYVFVLDEKAMQWQLYGEGISGSFTWSFVNSGTLVSGYSAARSRGLPSATRIAH
jgi:hypothetical protein